MPKIASPKPKTEENEISNAKSAEIKNPPTPVVDTLLALPQTDDPDLIAAQKNEQNAVLEAQQAERPLAAAQHALDVKAEELIRPSDSESEDEELYGDKVATPHNTPPPSPHKQSLLRNDDVELSRLGIILKNVWETFYDGYRRNVEEAQREKHLIRLEGRSRNLSETGKVPDIRDIVTQMRTVILGGVTILFTGVIPLTTNWQKYSLFPTR